MRTEEWSKIWHNAKLDIELLHAHYIKHAYPRHSHDYFVVSLIERGYQSFTHKGTKYLTPPGGIILINPDAVHTGEAVDEQGFELRSLYPTTSHMELAVLELTGRHQALPFFKDVRVRGSLAANNILSLHRSISEGASSLESESRFIWTLAQLIKEYADISYSEQEPGKEKKAIQQVIRYIEEFYAQSVSLKELAQYAALSPYYFLRVFRNEVGMPPHAYLETVRIRQAQRLLKAGKSLAEVSVEAGFSSQSHMTRRFKKIIGATPGQYAQQVRS
jgi:AraC-like DNA-binding protein